MVVFSCQCSFRLTKNRCSRMLLLPGQTTFSIHSIKQFATHLENYASLLNMQLNLYINIIPQQEIVEVSQTVQTCKWKFVGRNLTYQRCRISNLFCIIKPSCLLLCSSIIRFNRHEGSLKLFCNFECGKLPALISHCFEF